MTPSPTAAARLNTVAGPLLMVLAVLCFSCMDSILGVLVTRHSAWFLVWARSLIQVVAVLAIVLALGWRDALICKRPGLQVARGLTLVATSVSLTLALRTIPLTQAYAIGFSAPLIAALIAALFLAEWPSLRTWGLIAAGFLGVLVALDPAAPDAGPALLLPVAFAIANAVFHVLTRLGAQSEHPITQLFYPALVATAVLAAALPWSFAPFSGTDLALLLAAGLAGTMAHLLLIRAFALAPTAVVSPMVYVQVVWAALIGYLAFGRLPTASTLLGAVIVVGAGVVMIRSSAGGRARAG
jgi:drug/metabolite transporter (DMT)-like permease